MTPPKVDSTATAPAPVAPPGREPQSPVILSLAEGYRRLHRRVMAGLPICHPALEVAVLGFRPWSLAEDEAGGEGSGPGWLGVVLTPWMLSIALLPAEAGAWDRLEPGRRRELELPAGRFLFQAGNLEDFGGLWLSSLISPMAGFSGQAMALDAAQAALEAVLTVPPPPPPAALSRRALFGARPLASRLGEPLPGGPAAHA